MKTGTNVTIDTYEGPIYGTTIEKPTTTTRAGKVIPVVRVKWDDNTQSIEDIDALTTI